MNREQGKIEFIEQDDGSWFWCILKWDEYNKGWYNSCCGNNPDRLKAVCEAFDSYENM